MANCQEPTYWRVTFMPNSPELRQRRVTFTTNSQEPIYWRVTFAANFPVLKIGELQFLLNIAGKRRNSPITFRNSPI